MTNLKQVLAINMKQYRKQRGLTQANLAEKANASTQYIAMIELGRKFPSLELLERLAIALEIDNLDLFSPPPFPVENIKKLQKTFISDIEKEMNKAVCKAVTNSLKTIVNNYLIEENTASHHRKPK